MIGFDHRPNGVIGGKGEKERERDRGRLKRRGKRRWRGKEKKEKGEELVKDDAKFFNFCSWKCRVHINKRGRKTASGKSLKERSRFQFQTCSI